ncbi:MAG TPA: CehA/McbA family metallohydrolase [Steroidobacteraceae bacterium]
MTRAARILLALLPLLAPAPGQAAREAVLNQVKLPHNYYWRELYIPQLTTGPSAVAFMPSGDELIFSVDGSLWRQRIGDGVVYELTHADGAYDYQPDVAPDGATVVFSRYDGRAFELWRLDLATGETAALTANGGVNVEPRLSPDGGQLVWVSTAGTGHFNLKIAEITSAGLANERYLVAPRESRVDRYYYSTHDHAINPSWTPDGTRVYYVGNAEIPWGTGAICSVAVDDLKYECTTRHRLETSWAARPEVGPDGKRILFSNYHGGQWHQLWLTTTDDAAPLPLTYGEFDRRNARWSPDGKRIAYISNEHGNTSLVVQELAGGARVEIRPQMVRRLMPPVFLVIYPQDAAGKPIFARVSVLGSDRRWHGAWHAWLHGDEAYDRVVFPSEPRYLHCAELCSIKVPPGKAVIRVQSGFRRLPAMIEREFSTGEHIELPIRLEDNDLPADFGKFVSADLHVHMNYGGHYRSTPESLLSQAEAEDLDVVHNLIVNKEERIPDVAYFRPDADPASGDRILLHAQEYHTSFWGHLGLLHLSDHLLLPDYTSYRHTALESPWPHNGVVADLAHAQDALVGYVHIADFPIDPSKEKSLSYQLPADVAHGKVDYLEVMGFSDHHITAEIWYRLLNLGFRLPAGAGTDAMANYASLRGPVGLVRVFLDTDGARTPEALLDSLKSGKSFVSNSALLGLELGGQRPGASIPRADGRLPLRASLRSPVAMDHLELVQNGRVIQTFELKEDRRRFDWYGEVSLEEGGWIVLRAWNDAAHPDVLDLYPYATTSPIYIDSPAAPPAPADAAYFVAWMDRVIRAAVARGGWNEDSERRETLDYLNAAREKFRVLAAKKTTN